MGLCPSEAHPHSAHRNHCDEMIGPQSARPAPDATRAAQIPESTRYSPGPWGETRQGCRGPAEEISPNGPTRAAKGQTGDCSAPRQDQHRTVSFHKESHPLNQRQQ